jgi:D-lactate dehydrogenase
MSPMPHQRLVELLGQRLENVRIITDPDLCLAHGTDASFYRLVPKLIVKLNSIDEIVFTMQLCRQLKVPYTFRAAGTSLSGQAISDSVLITLSNDWRGHEIIDAGKKIRLQPGVIGADANRYLAPLGRKIGPDPASINSCKIGGIAANNASGMCCGTAHNTYNTVDAITVVLYDGTILDTSDPDCVERFRHSHFDLLEALQHLQKEVAENQELTARIKHKYRLKNTTGYAINALIDYTDPIDILIHLMIGSEGTLGFIADITYKTVEDHPFKATTLVVMPNIENACIAVSNIAQLEVAAVELMDGRALASVAGKPNMPEMLSQLSIEECALLIEVHANNQAELDRLSQQVLEHIDFAHLVSQIPFTQNQEQVNKLWAMRKGMFPAVGAVREVGTTVIIEDVAFPVERLAEGVRALQTLFEIYHYEEAIIFGHALEGNLHFVFTQGFDDPSEVTRYGNFMQKVATLVGQEFGGSLKAEHGTGRNMAPFVELEWGVDAYQLMQRIKRILDPEGLLNPGVILNQNENAHLEHLKPLPKADPIVDKCIECGFCEAVCPSKGLTLTPRQRIVMFREIQRRQSNSESTEELKATFDYQGVDTCAATGLCADRCPVGINTGDLIKQVRQKKYQGYIPIAKWTAEHFSVTTTLVKTALSVNDVSSKLVGDKTMDKAINGLRKVSKNKTPKWLKQMPTANRYRLESTEASATDKTVVYLPSCASRTMGQGHDAQDQRPLTEVMTSLLSKAGYRVIIPKTLNEQCCGMPYESKGMPTIADQKSAQMEVALWEASDQGKYPIVMDTSPCVKRMLEHTSRALTLYEPMHFVEAHLMDHLQITPTNEPVMLHVTCSTKRMGHANSMLSLANRCSNKVIVPEHIECCGWAGDKGFSTPELNENALSPLKGQVPNGCERGFSNSRSCEIGLSHHSGVPYQSLLYLVDEVSTSVNNNSLNTKGA